MLRFAGIALAVFTMPAAAQSQEMTDQDLLALFEKQRSAFRAAEADQHGQTRGLELLTLENIDVATETATLEAPQIEVSGNATPVETAEAEPTLVTTGPKRIGKLDPELQVNVRVTFAFDSAALAPEQKPKLAQLCSVMKSSDINLFRISGHTDASGSDEYNQRLSMLRAQEVQRYFVNDCGMDPERIEAIGLGERLLFDPEQPRADENRRVEFQALS